MRISIVSLTDHQGVRLYYHPPQDKTNPIGKPIRRQSWQMAVDAKIPGIFSNTGSDGVSRIFAFEQVRLKPGGDPYLYVWAGIPEASILQPANSALIRNILLLITATALALFIARIVGKNALVSPINSLVDLTRKFTEGNLEARSESIVSRDEFSTMAKAFHHMAETISKNQTMQDDLINDLERALAEIRTLQGILPICQHCKKIRDDKGSWKQIEAYISEHSEAVFSHGICEKCMEDLYPDVAGTDN